MTNSKNSHKNNKSQNNSFTSSEENRIKLPPENRSGSPLLLDFSLPPMQELDAYIKKNPYDIVLFNYHRSFGLSNAEPFRIFKYDPTAIYNLWIEVTFREIHNNLLLNTYEFLIPRQLSMYHQFLGFHGLFDPYLEKIPIQIDDLLLICNSLYLIALYKRHFEVKILYSYHQNAYENFIKTSFQPS